MIDCTSADTTQQQLLDVSASVQDTVAAAGALQSVGEELERSLVENDRALALTDDVAHQEHERAREWHAAVATLREQLGVSRHEAEVAQGTVEGLSKELAELRATHRATTVALAKAKADRAHEASKLVHTDVGVAQAEKLAQDARLKASGLLKELEEAQAAAGGCRWVWQCVWQCVCQWVWQCLRLPTNWAVVCVRAFLCQRHAEVTCIGSCPHTEDARVATRQVRRELVATCVAKEEAEEANMTLQVGVAFPHLFLFVLFFCFVGHTLVVSLLAFFFVWLLLLCVRVCARCF